MNELNVQAQIKSRRAHSISRGRIEWSICMLIASMLCSFRSLCEKEFSSLFFFWAVCFCEFCLPLLGSHSSVHWPLRLAELLFVLLFICSLLFFLWTKRISTCAGTQWNVINHLESCFLRSLGWPCLKISLTPLHYMVVTYAQCDTHT